MQQSDEKLLAKSLHVLVFHQRYTWQTDSHGEKTKINVDFVMGMPFATCVKKH